MTKQILLALVLGVVTVAGCSSQIDQSTEAEAVAALSGIECSAVVWAGKGAERSYSAPGESWDDCRDLAYRAGDEYCDYLRSGGSGPNPVWIRYTLYYADLVFQDWWEFGCAL